MWASPTRPGRPGRPARPIPPPSVAASPPARFIQYRAKLATTDPRRTPELRSVSVSYRTSNLSPEITRLDVPDLSTADGAARQTRLNLRWDATDPNDDDLNYTLTVRKEGWPEWIELFDEPITEKTFAWDTTAFPSGTYRVKLAGQRSTVQQPRRGPDARPGERDIHRRPRPAGGEGDAARKAGAAIALKDELTRLVKADYALDGGHWVPDLSRRRPVRHARGKDHALTSRLEARDAFAHGSRHRFGRQSRHG